MPKVRGREKIPEPTMDPTTMAVSAKSESFWTDCVLNVPPLTTIPRFSLASTPA